MHKKMNSVSLLSLSLLLVLFLPGCRFADWIKEKFGGGVKPITQTQAEANDKMPQETAKSLFVREDGSKVLASMQGRPLVTEKSLTQDIKLLSDANQEVKMIVSLYGEDEIKRGLVQRKVTSAIYQKFLQDQGVDKTPEYQQELARLLEAITDQFNQMYFLKALPVSVSEQEKHEWYEKNKDTIPNLKISEGGVKAMGVLFDAEDKAKSFLAKAKEAQGDLKRAAQLAHVADDQVKDFNLVHANSLGVDEGIKNALVTLKTFPATQLIKTDKGVWVVSATSKEETKYHPYEQVANDIVQLLDRNKRTEAAEGKLDELRKAFNVVIAEELVKPVEAQADNMPGAPQMRMAQQDEQAMPMQQAARPV